MAFKMAVTLLQKKIIIIIIIDRTLRLRPFSLIFTNLVLCLMSLADASLLSYNNLIYSRTAACCRCRYMKHCSCETTESSTFL